MGCGNSKLEEEEAVMHCRARSALLADVIRHRYDFANAHESYVRSLLSASDSLNKFLLSLLSLPPIPDSHRLQLPAHRKADPPPLTPSPIPLPVAAASVRKSHSRSGSVGSGHIDFLSSESDDSDGDSHLHSEHGEGHDRPSHQELVPPNAGTYYSLNYARSRPAAPSVAYEQRPQEPESVHHYYGPEPGLGSQAYSNFEYHSFPQPQSSNYFPYQDPYTSYGAGGGGGIGSYFWSGSGPPANNTPPVPPSRAVPGSSSSSRELYAAPSPPKVSSWDFFNPFESFENYNVASYPQTPSQNSKELREEEGIPDLEEEDDHVVVKQAYVDMQKGKMAMEDPVNSSAGEGGKHRSTGSVESSSSGSNFVESDTQVVKNVAVDQLQRPPMAPHAMVQLKSYENNVEVVKEIHVQFVRASVATQQAALMLEVGKMPYHLKNSSPFKVSSSMICGLASLATSTGEELPHFEEEKAMGCGNLSSTLQALYMWELKLLDEVKVEEDLRVQYERKCEELNYLDERGAEAYKIDATQMLIRKLSTKISIAVQIVNTISRKISKLRDEELWPEILELIQGLKGMWLAMLESHRIQCHAITEARNIDAVLYAANVSNVHMDTTRTLVLDLVEWTTSFSSWIYAQRNYIKKLNEWLLKGVNYVPEVTDDGVPPLSPGRLGAPPVFVICNHWAQSMDRVSPDEVTNAMVLFTRNVFNLWSRHRSEKRQRLMANGDMDASLRSMERDEQMMQRALEKIGDVADTLPGQVEPHEAAISHMQSSLKVIFEAMENFSSSIAKVYEELLFRSEEIEKQNRTVS